MKRLLRFIAFSLALLILAGCAGRTADAPANSGNENVPADTTAEWSPVTVKDDLDREITFTEKPERVAALMGSFAETWLLAGGDLIAAPKDAWEDFDLSLSEEVVDLGSYMKISAEALFGLNPDLVIASSNTKSQMEMKDTLEGAGLNVLFFDVNGFEDYLRMLETCAAITGRADLYEENGTAIRAEVEAAKTAALSALDGKDAPRVLFIRTAASGIHVKGSDGTVLGLMLKDLGCVNIADGNDLLENLSIEKIIEEDPDRIFIVMQGSDEEGAKKTLEDTLTGSPAWGGLTAVKEGRVHWMDKKLYHLKPNNRWGIAYDELEKLLYGE